MRPCPPETRPGWKRAAVRRIFWRGSLYQNRRIDRPGGTQLGCYSRSAEGRNYCHWDVRRRCNFPPLRRAFAPPATPDPPRKRERDNPAVVENHVANRPIDDPIGVAL